MSRVSAVLLLAGLAFAAIFASWPAGGSSSASCTDVSPTPTGDPTPSPLPPFTPYEVVSICNDTGQAVSDLHILLAHSAVNENPIIGNIPGCPEPAYFYGGSPAYATVDIDWGTPCVPLGGDVTLSFDAGCSTPESGCGAPRVQCFYWTLDGAPVPSASPAVNPPICANPSPIPTATPQPTGPCPARGTPAVTPPAVTPVPDIPSPGSTWRDYGISVIITLCNDTVASASDLHVDFSFPYSFFWLMANPPGCPEPSFTPDPHSLDEYRFEVDWGEDCVNPGEFLSMGFHYWCGHICGGPQPYCYTWTRFGQPVYQGQGDCLPPTPTPTATITPTPPVDVRIWTFPNDTGQSASNLHARFNGPFIPRMVENAPGCPEPQLAHETYSFEFDLEWGVGCVGAGESIKVEITSEPPVNPRCSDWSFFGDRLFSAGLGGCPSPGDIDCSGGVGSVDALKDLRFVADLDLSLPPTCDFRGDVDCDGDVDSTDALGILRFVAKAPVLPQHEPCPDIVTRVAMPTPSPTPTPTPGTMVTFANNSGASASGLHFFAVGPMQGFDVRVTENAEGCVWANGSASHTTLGPDFTFEVDVQFSSECVDDGEAVTVILTCSNPETYGCTPTILGDCADWTVSGSIIDAPCPTPDCGGVPCCMGLPCPTASPPGPHRVRR